MAPIIDLSGKVALVTGAGRGIGLGCARQLARAGAVVVLNDRPGSGDLGPAVEEIRACSPSCHGIEADVFSRQGCERLVAETLSLVERIDILISNPAFSCRGAFLDYDPDVFEQTVRGTLLGGFHMSQLVARHLVARRSGGKILFVSSVQAQMPMAGTLAYGASKAGLNRMMQAIAVELSPHRINVNAIEPGWIDTPGEHQTFSDDVIECAAKRLPWGRLGTPDDIGRAAAFLVSEAADYITGAVLPVDGGFRFKDCLAEKLVEGSLPS